MAGDTTMDGAERIEGSPEPEQGGEIQTIWSLIQEELSSTLRRDQYETWFYRLALIHVDGRCVRLAVHNPFTRDWLFKHYQEVIESVVERVIGSRRILELVVDPEAARPPQSNVQRSDAERSDSGSGPAGAPALGKGGLLPASDVGLNDTYRFDSFVVGPCNRFAHAACVGVSERPGSVYNPLFLHGNVGLGKTHLLQSLCRSVLQRTPSARILYLACETFVNHFVEALENGDLQRFRNRYRNVDVLVVDDIHHLANKARTQEEFFHTFNTLYNANRQIVLSSDSPPVDIPTLQERLVSRFRWGLVTEVEPPCFETRMAILKRKSRERGRELTDEVAALLAERIDSNIRELEGAVNRLLGFASLTGKAATVDTVRHCLGEIFAVVKGQPSIEDVLSVVVGHYRVKPGDIQSRRRTAAVSSARQVAMYLARQITPLSLAQVGGFFGGRDHTTVLYAVRKVSAKAKDDPAFRSVLSKLLLELRAP